MHAFGIRVYYEDTDLAGIVYYANYLKFIERARSEFLRDLGVDQVRLKTDSGIVFAVRRVEADYLSPAHFDDELIVMTTIVETRGARVVLSQDVLRGETTLFKSEVTVVAMDNNGRPSRLPVEIADLLKGGGQ